MEGPIERRIRERVRSFDIPALLAVLEASGYGDAEIEYRGQRTTVHQSHLVHDIEFIHEPDKRVVITVNMGLLSAQSPLPSFLMQTMDQLDHDRLERFICYFDHPLPRDCFAGRYPGGGGEGRGGSGIGCACCAPPAPAPCTGSSARSFRKWSCRCGARCVSSACPRGSCGWGPVRSARAIPWGASRPSPREGWR